MVLKKILITLMIVLPFAVVSGDLGDIDMRETRSLIDDITSLRINELKRSIPACPAIILGTKCPEATAFYYFNCCGQLYADCCFRLQDWVTFLIIAIVGLTIIGVILRVLTYMCRR